MIVVFGSLNADLIFAVDHLPAPGETVLGTDTRIEPGGKGANQAAAAARDGATVLMAGAVGRDPLADIALDGLRAASVDLSRVARVEAATGCAAICTDPAGRNQIAVGSGANALRARRSGRGCRPNSRRDAAAANGMRPGADRRPDSPCTSPRRPDHAELGAGSFARSCCLACGRPAGGERNGGRLARRSARDGRRRGRAAHCACDGCGPGRWANTARSGPAPKGRAMLPRTRSRLWTPRLRATALLVSWRPHWTAARRCRPPLPGPAQRQACAAAEPVRSAACRGQRRLTKLVHHRLLTTLDVSIIIVQTGYLNCQNETFCINFRTCWR